MKRYIGALLVASTAFFIALSASAQNVGRINNHAVPIGKGLGVQGVGNLGPCNNGIPFVGLGVNADPACGQVDLTAGVQNQLPVTNGGTGSSSASGARTNLGVAIGSNVEAWDNDLDCVAALSSTGQIKRTGSGTCSAGAVALSDLATGTQDTVIGYFGSTTGSALAIGNCSNALTYSTSTHTFGCNSTAGTGTVTQVNSGTGLTGGPVTNSGTLAADPGVFQNYKSKLVLSTPGASANFSVSAGVATDGGNAAFMVLASSYTKSTSAWAVGTSVGSLDTGTIAANTWYHVFLMRRPDTGLVDVCISVSVTGCTTGSNIPSAYTQLRRIGSMKTNASSQWTSFVQIGNEFRWAMPVNDVNNANPGTTATAYTLSVPPGVSLMARFHTGFSNSGGIANALIYSPLASTQAVSSPTANNTLQNPSGTYAYQDLSIITNTLAQVMAVCGTASGNVLYMTTFGWTDNFGQY